MNKIIQSLTAPDLAESMDNESRKLGYKVACLTSSKMGYGVYSKIGFKDIFSYTNYSLAP